MDIPSWINFGKHASELVCVAIGVNLLFPAAPSFYKRFLKNVETNPQKLYRLHFGMFKGDLTAEEAKSIGEVAKPIEERRCLECGHWIWTVLEIVAVMFGCASLWCGLVDKLGGWVIALFVPVIMLMMWTGGCSLVCRHGLRKKIKTVSASMCQRLSDEHAPKNDSFVQAFAEKMLAES